jgi:hypothetical protein
MVFALSACKKEKDNTIKKDDISTSFPFIKEGNAWHYALINSDSSAAGGPNALNYKILSVGNNGYIKVEEEVFSFMVTTYWYSDKNGFSDDTLKLTLLKVNPVLNDTWSLTNNGETITRKVVALNDSVQLYDKTYINNCVKVHETNPELPQGFRDIWVSKDDGIVQIKGKGYYSIDDGSLVYFDCTYVLMSKSF